MLDRRRGADGEVCAEEAPLHPARNHNRLPGGVPRKGVEGQIRTTALAMSSGGAIAWGIVPTLGFSGGETLDGLSSRLQKGLEKLYSPGLDPGRVARQSLFAPACGTGTIAPVTAKRVLALLRGLSVRWVSNRSDGLSLPGPDARLFRSAL